MPRCFSVSFSEPVCMCSHTVARPGGIACCFTMYRSPLSSWPVTSDGSVGSGWAATGPENAAAGMTDATQTGEFIEGLLQGTPLDVKCTRNPPRFRADLDQHSARAGMRRRGV